MQEQVIDQDKIWSQSIRQASRHLRTNYHPSYDVEPFKVQQVADTGDMPAIHSI